MATTYIHGVFSEQFTFSRYCKCSWFQQSAVLNLIVYRSRYMVPKGQLFYCQYSVKSGIKLLNVISFWISIDGFFKNDYEEMKLRVET